MHQTHRLLLIPSLPHSLFLIFFFFFFFVFVFVFYKPKKECIIL
ncbi:unnamed protein product, partial [Vitis vinifera]